MPFMQPKGGWVELICGSMFSGKTEELIRRVRRAQIAKQKVQVFKPQIDNRYSITRVASHSGLQWDSHIISAPHEIWDFLAADTNLVAIDEVQFGLTTAGAIGLSGALAMDAIKGPASSCAAVQTACSSYPCTTGSVNVNLSASCPLPSPPAPHRRAGCGAMSLGSRSKARPPGAGRAPARPGEGRREGSGSCRCAGGGAGRGQRGGAKEGGQETRGRRITGARGAPGRACARECRRTGRDRCCR
jgi:hypothetical protein